VRLFLRHDSILVSKVRSLQDFQGDSIGRFRHRLAGAAATLDAIPSKQGSRSDTKQSPTVRCRCGPIGYAVDNKFSRKNGSTLDRADVVTTFSQRGCEYGDFMRDPVELFPLVGVV
jgi:hypothetical protein